VPPAEPASDEGWFGKSPSEGHASQDKAASAPAAVPEPPPPPPPPAPRTYTVVSGDTLWAISERFYGDGNQYQRIADASGVNNPDLIYPGQVLTIP
jgi:nucleoid-associated protein YgaU